MSPVSALLLQAMQTHHARAESNRHAGGNRGHHTGRNAVAAGFGRAHDFDGSGESGAVCTLAILCDTHAWQDKTVPAAEYSYAGYKKSVVAPDKINLCFASVYNLPDVLAAKDQNVKQCSVHGSGTPASGECQCGWPLAVQITADWKQGLEQRNGGTETEGYRDRLALNTRLSSLFSTEALGSKVDLVFDNSWTREVSAQRSPRARATLNAAAGSRHRLCCTERSPAVRLSATAAPLFESGKHSPWSVPTGLLPAVHGTITNTIT